MTFPIAFQKTFRENWPKQLTQISVPAISFTLLPQEIDFIGQWQNLYSDHYSPVFAKRCPSLELKIDNAFQISPRLFPKLSFCSWKSSTSPALAPCTTCLEVISHICQSNDRIDSYLTAAKAQYTPVCLHLVTWRNLQFFDEVRLFFYKKQLVGASTYHEDINAPISAVRAREIADTIQKFSEQICLYIPLDSVIVDCLIPRLPSGQPEVLELNPFSTLTSAAHFSWDEGFPNEFRSLLQRIKI